jgi:hypothetical protein
MEDYRQFKNESDIRKQQDLKKQQELQAFLKN